MMLGLTEPTSGSVKVCGIDSTTHPIEVKRRVGYLPEDVGFYEDYTGLENLMYTARLNRMPEADARQKANELLGRVGLERDADKKAGKYSRGMRQRLGLADVLIKNPEVIILDEPTLGIDPQGVREFLDLIARLSKEEGLTVMLSSHHLNQVQEVCDRVGLFVGGKLLAEGNIQTLSQKLFSNTPFVIEAGIGFSLLNGKAKQKEGELTDALQQVDGVLTVNREEDIVHIGCSRNATADIARAIVKT